MALRFAYDGGAFRNGYARQPDGGTVEDALLVAARQEGYIAGSWRTGSRTDKGVGAAENVAKCALDREHLTGLVPALQAHLPPGLWVTGAAPVGEDWTPRHGAVRTYLYVAPKQGESLDAMQEGAACFVGEHDMRGFARLEDHRDPQRSVQGCTVEDAGDAWHVTVSSPGFLWNQVRRMVDALLAVGRGDATAADITASLQSGTPHPRFHMATPEGLLLRSVRYVPDLPWADEAGVLDPRRLDGPWQRQQVNGAMLDILRQ